MLKKVKDNIKEIENLFNKAGYSETGEDERVRPSSARQSYYKNSLLSIDEINSSSYKAPNPVSSNLLFDVKMNDSRIEELWDGDEDYTKQLFEIEFKKALKNKANDIDMDDEFDKFAVHSLYEYGERINEYTSDLNTVVINKNQVFSNFVEKVWSNTELFFKKNIKDIESVYAVDGYMLVQYEKLPFLPKQGEKFLQEMVEYGANLEKVNDKLEDFKKGLETIISLIIQFKNTFDIAYEKVLRIQMEIYMQENYPTIDFSESLYFSDKRNVGKIYQKTIKQMYSMEKSNDTKNSQKMN